ncbi:MAG: DDE-type integrase/transposase/recombinase, partial [Moorellales bacterium]
KPSVADKVEIVDRWTEQGYSVSLVCDFVGLAPSTYYAVQARRNRPDSAGKTKTKANRGGRPQSNCCLTRQGEVVPDEQVKEWLCEIISGDGFPYGYRKLTAVPKQEYGLIVNHKKVYRLCKELGILLPQRKKNFSRPRQLARREDVSGPNQLWQMDVKYGYIAGTEQFFFQLSLIDVYDRTVIDYHLGLSCTAQDAAGVLKNSLRARGLAKGMSLPKLRTDNGPQFIAKRFEETCMALGVVHERTPVKTPNLKRLH